MPTVYLHIGMPKTGTTFVQFLLRKNNAVLRKHGYDYVRTRYKFSNISNLRNAHFLIPEQMDENKNPLPDKDREIYKLVLPRVIASAKKFGNAIISDELLWLRENVPFKQFKDALNKKGIDLKVIVYLRRQDTFIESYWGQLVKINVKLPFKDYASLEHQDYLKLDFEKRLAYLEDIFGFENMIVRVYEREQFAGKNKNLVSDFLEAIGLGDKIDETTDFEGFNNPEFSSVNYSLGGIYLETKRLLNQVSTFHTKNNFVVEMLYNLMQKDENPDRTKTKIFTYSERLEFMKRYEASNQAVADKYLNGGSLYKEKIKNDNSEDASYTIEEITKICAQIIAAQHKELAATKKSLEKTQAKADKLKERYIEQKLTIKELKKTVKHQQSTINWITTSFPKKVVRKLKNTFKKKTLP